MNGARVVTSGIDVVTDQGNTMRHFDLTPFVHLLRPGTNIIGVLINSRKINAIEKSANAATDGPLPQVLAAQISDPVLFGTTHAITLAVIAIIWNMTVKPGDAQAGIVIVFSIALGALSALPMAMKQQSVLERGA